MANLDIAPPLPLRTHQTHGARPHTANSIPLPTRVSRTPHHHHTIAPSPHAHHVQGIDQIKTQQKWNDYVEIGNPTLPPRRKSLPSNTRSHSHSRLQDNPAKKCEDLTVYCGDYPPPLMPRLPRRQSKPVIPVRSVLCPQPPPIRRDTKPPIHKLESFHGPHKQQRIPVSAVLFVDTSTKSNKLDTWESRHVMPRQTVVPRPVIAEPKTEKSGKSKSSKLESQQHAALDNNGQTQSVIRCADCGKCKCKSCCEDRKLPEKWLCGGNCRLSADSCVDAVTCMCIAKGITYHTCDEFEGEQVEHPCSCTNTPSCCKRWATLGLLSLCFPCLLCYLPLKGGVKAAEACYNGPCARQRGCQCDR